jgi:hypothetical protein
MSYFCCFFKQNTEIKWKDTVPFIPNISGGYVIHLLTFQTPIFHSIKNKKE